LRLLDNDQVDVAPPGGLTPRVRTEQDCLGDSVLAKNGPQQCGNGLNVKRMQICVHRPNSLPLSPILLIIDSISVGSVSVSIVPD
jgi:hypothetical protein